MQEDELIPLTRNDEADIKREVEQLKYKYKLKRRHHVSMSKYEHNVDLNDTSSPQRISTAMTKSKSRVKFDLKEKSNCDYLTESPQGMSRLHHTRTQSSVHKIRSKRYREAIESLIDPNTSYAS
jgi:hypothetical protein